MARRVTHDTWSKIFATAYLMLGVNVLLLLSCAPFLVLALVADPLRAWPLLAALAVPCAPALVGAFTAFRRHDTDEGPWWVPRAFVAGWRAGMRPALVIGALTTALVTVLAVDIAWLSTQRAGALLIPVVIPLIVLTLACALHALVAIAEHPTAPIREVLLASLVLGIRRWYLTALSVLALATLTMLLSRSPGVAVGLAAAPLWYVAWANCRYALRPVIGEPAAIPA